MYGISEIRIGGFGAAAAFVFASGSYAYDLFDKRRGRERSQAVKVDGWVDHQGWVGPAAQTLEVVVALVNDNQVAMRNVSVVVTSNGLSDFPEKAIGLIVPTLREHPQTVSLAFEPGAHPTGLKLGADPVEIDIRIEFTDGDNVRWRRSGSRLAKIAGTAQSPRPSRNKLGRVLEVRGRIAFLVATVAIAVLTGYLVSLTGGGSGSATTINVISGASSKAQSQTSSTVPSQSASVGYDGPAICSPTTDAATSGSSPTALMRSATEVASGTIEGKRWSLWSADGQPGAAGLEDGGVVFDGREYGLCPGYPNPSETEMIDTGGDAVIYGVVDYPGLAQVQLSTGTINSFAVGRVLPSPTERRDVAQDRRGPRPSTRTTRGQSRRRTEWRYPRAGSPGLTPIVATLLVPCEHVMAVLDECIRGGEELVSQAEIVENAGGHRDWIHLFARWREHTLAELRAVYDDDEVPLEFEAVTSTTEHSTPRLTFPYTKSTLELAVWHLRNLLKRLPLAVEPEGSPQSRPRLVSTGGDGLVARTLDPRVPNGPSALTEATIDFFVSHASEDKESIARPLSQRLSARGYSLWLDEAELTIGDSLRQRIDEGLRSCRYGIVILSPNFFRKNWPQYELDGLVTCQMNGHKLILPVWHNVDHSAVADYSPTLAGYVAARSSNGVESVVDEIVKAYEAGW